MIARTVPICTLLSTLDRANTTLALGGNDNMEGISGLAPLDGCDAGGEARNPVVCGDVFKFTVLKPADDSSKVEFGLVDLVPKGSQT